jgi:hypothetical protein
MHFNRYSSLGTKAVKNSKKSFYWNIRMDFHFTLQSEIESSKMFIAR